MLQRVSRKLSHHLREISPVASPNAEGGNYDPANEDEDVAAAFQDDEADDTWWGDDSWWL